MDFIKRGLWILVISISLAFLCQCKKCDLDEMNREDFAMCMIMEVFENNMTGSGVPMTVFGEIKAGHMSENLKAYQMQHQLNVTGIIDDETIAEMSKPYCGMKDMKDKSQDTRKKRYATTGSMWNNDSPLTYRFKNFSPDLDRTIIRRVAAQALKAWSDVTNLEFLEITSTVTADIEIIFGAREHGDGRAASFDGTGGVLAHAYFPSTDPLGGDAHFDEDELWTDGKIDGINLLQVFIHEIGHSLGLGHSNVRSAIMFPTYIGYVANVTLDQDDILGIQSLYGEKETVPIKTTTMPSTSDRKTFCTGGNFDDIVSFQGVTYAFKGLQYAALSPSGIISGYPRPIDETFKGGVSGNIDAALAWNHSTPRLYLFKGDKYWRYNISLQLVPGYPRHISSGFSGLPNNIDAAFVWGRNGRTYVFKGNHYYRLSGTSNKVDRGYPRAQSVWGIGSALGGNITAAFQWSYNRRTYFFRGDNYIRYDDYKQGVESKYIPPYPRLVADWWLMCPKECNVMGEMQDGAELGDKPKLFDQSDNNDQLDTSDNNDQLDTSDNNHPVNVAQRLHNCVLILFTVMLASRVFGY